MSHLMWDIINTQAEVLRPLLSASDIDALYEQGLSLHYERYVVVGSGSSYNAALASKRFFEHVSGRRMAVMFPYELEDALSPEHDFPLQSTLVIGISQSGTSSSTVNAIRHLRVLGYTCLTLTEQRNTPLEHLGQFTLNFGCGEEKIGAKTKGYTATLIQLHRIGLAIGEKTGFIHTSVVRFYHQELQRSLEAFEGIILQTEAWVNAHPDWAKASVMTVIGHDGLTATAIEGALKITETLTVPCLPIDVDEYAHGSFCYLKPESHLIVVVGPGHRREALEKTINYLRQKTPHVLVVRVGKTKHHPEDLLILPLGEISNTIGAVVPFQVLAFMWPQVLGLDPNRPKNRDYPICMQSHTAEYPQ